jgi:hypothetical protein
MLPLPRRDRGLREEARALASNPWGHAGATTLEVDAALAAALPSVRNPAEELPVQAISK